MIERRGLIFPYRNVAKPRQVAGYQEMAHVRANDELMQYARRVDVLERELNDIVQHNTRLRVLIAEKEMQTDE